MIFAFALFCPKKSRKVKLVLIEGGKSTSYKGSTEV